MRYLIYLLLLLYTIFSSGQNNSLLSHLTKLDGLELSKIYAMTYDDDHFLWLEGSADVILPTGGDTMTGSLKMISPSSIGFG